MTERQVAWMDRESERLGIPSSELMRRAFDEFIDKTERRVPRVRRKLTKGMISRRRQSEMPLQTAA